MDYKDVLEELKKNKLGQLYLFHGIEHYLMENTLQVIKEKIIPAGFETLNYQTIDGRETSYNEIRNACETMPLMSEKRIVVIKDFEALYSKKGSIGENEENKLLKYLENLPETTHLFFLAMDSIDKRKKIVKKIGKCGKSIEFSKLMGKDLYKWIEKTFRKFNKTIKGEEIEILIDTIGYRDKNSVKNLKDIENEIIKIANYAGSRDEVTAEDIQLLAQKTIENNVFSMVEALGTKDGGKALMYLHEMLLDGEAEIKILHMITRQFRLLFKVKLLENQGYTSVAIAPKLGMQQFIVKRLLKQSLSFNAKALQKAMEECLRTDRDIKKGRINPRLGIEILISKFMKL